MNDFDELKQLAERVTSVRLELKKIADEINKAFLTFEEMNYDCDDEIDEIEDKIDELTDELKDSVQKEKIQSKIDELIKKKELVQEAAEVLNDLEGQFNLIQTIAEDIDVEV